ncbi:MAG: class I SAM-dependent methyltransferase, partial [Actinomycetota bacterium]
MRHARDMFDSIAHRYDAMSTVFSYGTHLAWRRFLVSRLFAGPGDAVLDVATGTAGVAIEIARRTPARVVGIDQSFPMLQGGVQRIAEAGLTHRMGLVLGQAELLPFPDDAFQAVVFSYLLRYVDDPEAVVGELARVIRPGGVLASLEFHVPEHPVLRAGWYFQTRVALPALGRLASRHWFRSGRFLGPSISDWAKRYPLAAQRRMWEDAGIGDVAMRTFTFGSAVVI